MSSAQPSVLVLWPDHNFDTGACVHWCDAFWTIPLNLLSLQASLQGLYAEARPTKPFSTRQQCIGAPIDQTCNVRRAPTETPTNLQHILSYTRFARTGAVWYHKAILSQHCFALHVCGCSRRGWLPVYTLYPRRSQTEIKKLLRELDPGVAKGESIQHALRVRVSSVYLSASA